MAGARYAVWCDASVASLASDGGGRCGVHRHPPPAWQIVQPTASGQVRSVSSVQWRAAPPCNRLAVGRRTHTLCRAMASEPHHNFHRLSFGTRWREWDASFVCIVVVMDRDRELVAVNTPTVCFLYTWFQSNSHRKHQGAARCYRPYVLCLL